MADVAIFHTIEDAPLDQAVERLRAELRTIGPLVVAFSGGADSAFLAWMATDELGADDVECVTAVSASLPADELADCRDLARSWGLTWSSVATDELDDPLYQVNDADRCYHCKQALARALGPVAAEAGATVALGVNLDDLGDHRPGQQAALDHGAVFPLVAAGFTKAMVRHASRRLDLRTADKPAAACLASRIPYGTPVSLGVLGGVERAEAVLHRLGFDDVRVRHYDDTARLEVPVDRLSDVVIAREAVVDAVLAAGYRYVTLDLEGLRSGNLNTGLVGGPDAVFT
ncbi:ATP-dependent sacrificial sulfur transferase LarE [soil metagenome]